MTGGSPGTPPTSGWPLKSTLAPCMSEASRGRTRDRAAKPSPFACCSRKNYICEIMWLVGMFRKNKVKHVLLPKIKFLLKLAWFAEGRTPI